MSVMLSDRRWYVRGLLLLCVLALFAARSALPLASAAPAGATTATPLTSAPTPDALENNWSPATAAPVAVGVVYDLNFVCPVAWGCAGGDHDYLRLPVKRNLRYLIVTFDLGLGVDTELDLFWGDERRPLISNDDAIPGRGFLSAIRWVAPGDGEAIIRVAPRTGGTTPIVFDERGSAYRFAIALAGSPFAHQLEQTIAEQTGAPSARPVPSEARPGASSSPAPAAQSAPAPAAQPAPAPAPAGPSGNPSGPTTRGQAIVVARETAFRIAPNPNASLIGTLPADAAVTLAGQYTGLWVSITTADSVLPGWVLGTDLRRVNPAAPTSAITPTVSLAPAPTAPPSGAVAPTPNQAPVYRVRALAPLPLDPAPAPPPRAALTVVVTVVAGADAAGTPTPRATPTGAPSARPIAGMRVQLVDAFGELLAEAISGADGQVALTPDVAAGARLSVRIPAAGLETPVDLRAPALTIAIPTGDAP